MGSRTATSLDKKKKHGQLSKNKVPDLVYIVNKLGPTGQSIDPPSVTAKFSNTIRALVRTWLDPSINDWRSVTEGTKTFLWKQVKKVFQFPRGTEDLARSFAMKQTGLSFRRWRSELNTKYLQQGRTPFQDYGKITQAQWDAFVAAKKTEDALALSKHNSEHSKSNPHPHHLGTSGYKGLVEKRMRQQPATAPDGSTQEEPYNGLDECSYNWIKA